MNTSTELFREPGQAYLSPSRFAEVLGLDLNSLARALGVHRNTLRLHPESQRTQERLRDCNRVFLAMADINPNIQDVAFHMKNTPIRDLRQRTLFEVVSDGNAGDALLYLQSIASGPCG